MKGKVGLSQVGRKAVPPPWSSNWEYPVLKVPLNPNQLWPISKYFMPTM